MVRTTSGQFVAVDVNDLSDAITREMSSLKAELSSLRSEREHELRSVKRMLCYESHCQHFCLEIPFCGPTHISIHQSIFQSELTHLHPSPSR